MTDFWGPGPQMISRRSPAPQESLDRNAVCAPRDGDQGRISPKIESRQLCITSGCKNINSQPGNRTARPTSQVLPGRPLVSYECRTRNLIEATLPYDELTMGCTGLVCWVASRFSRRSRGVPVG